MILRQLISIALLPGLVTIAIPIWIARQDGIAFAAPDTLGAGLLLGLGFALLGVGLSLFSASLHSFWTRGRGTLAPWDPPRHFVVAGPYRFVRNPMISGVIFILCAEAAGLRSLPHAAWAATFALANGIQIPLIEEPQLAARFGYAYREYKQAVPRFLPRLTPWAPPRDHSRSD